MAQAPQIKNWKKGRPSTQLPEQLQAAFKTLKNNLNVFEVLVTTLKQFLELVQAFATDVTDVILKAQAFLIQQLIDLLSSLNKSGMYIFYIVPRNPTYSKLISFKSLIALAEALEIAEQQVEQIEVSGVVFTAAANFVDDLQDFAATADTFFVKQEEGLLAQPTNHVTTDDQLLAQSIEQRNSEQLTSTQNTNTLASLLDRSFPILYVRDALDMTLESFDDVFDERRPTFKNTDYFGAGAIMLTFNIEQAIKIGSIVSIWKSFKLICEKLGNVFYDDKFKSMSQEYQLLSDEYAALQRRFVNNIYGETQSISITFQQLTDISLFNKQYFVLRSFDQQTGAIKGFGFIFSYNNSEITQNDIIALKNSDPSVSDSRIEIINVAPTTTINDLPTIVQKYITGTRYFKVEIDSINSHKLKINTLNENNSSIVYSDNIIVHSNFGLGNIIEFVLEFNALTLQPAIKRSIDPDWHSYTFSDLFPAVGNVIKSTIDFLQGTLSRTNTVFDPFLKLLDAKIEQIDKLLQQIENYEKMIEDIEQALIAMNSFNIYTLTVEPQLNGLEIFKRSLIEGENIPNEQDNVQLLLIFGGGGIGVQFMLAALGLAPTVDLRQTYGENYNNFLNTMPEKKYLEENIAKYKAEAGDLEAQAKTGTFTNDTKSF